MISILKLLKLVTNPVTLIVEREQVVKGTMELKVSVLSVMW